MLVRVIKAVLTTFLLLPGLSQAAEPAFAVIEKVGGRVGFYDASLNRIGQVSVGAFPHEAVLAPDRRTLYVSVNGVLWMTEDAMGSNSIAVVDVPSMTKTGAIDLGRFHRPHGLAFDPDPHSSRHDGAPLRPRRHQHRVRQSGSRLRRQRQEPAHGDALEGRSPSMGQQHRLELIAIVDLKAGSTQVIPTGEGPQGGVFNAKGDRLYVTNAGPGRIAVIDTRSSKEVARIATNKMPGRVAITPDGRTLVYNTSDGVAFADVASNKQVTALDLKGDRYLSHSRVMANAHSPAYRIRTRFT